MKPAGHVACDLQKGNIEETSGVKLKKNLEGLLSVTFNLHQGSTSQRLYNLPKAGYPLGTKCSNA